MKSLVLLFALAAGTLASGNMKQKLAQMNAKNLAQNVNKGGNLAVGEGDNNCSINFGELPQVQLPECPCQFTNLPGLGAGQN
jgi:hypothetical protein